MEMKTFEDCNDCLHDLLVSAMKSYRPQTNYTTTYATFLFHYRCK